MESQTIGKLAEALSKAQAELGPVIKGAANPFFKSKYADLGSVIEAIRKPLTENGLSHVQYLREEGGDTFLVTKLMHLSGEWISGEMKLIPTKKDMQGMGSAITYAKRYGLAAMIGLGEEDDDGNAASHRSKDSVPHSQPIAPKAVEAGERPRGDTYKKSQLQNLMIRTGWTKNTLEGTIHRISDSKTKLAGELSDPQFMDLVRIMENEIAMADLK